MSEETKVWTNPNCSHGGEPQPITNFHIRTKDGKKRDSHCKDCKKNERHSYYLRKQKGKIKYTPGSKKYNKEHARAHNKKWRESFALFDSYGEKLREYYEEVRRDPENPDLLQVKCKNHLCEKVWFNPTNGAVSDRLKALRYDIKCENYLYCSDKCKQSCPAYKINHNDPYAVVSNSNGNKFWNKFRLNILMNELSKMVFARDGNKCVKCGASPDIDNNVELHVHHILPISVEPIFASDLWNCETVCKECHIKIHQQKSCSKENLHNNKIPQELLEKMIIE